jgi:hypothetical protein
VVDSDFKLKPIILAVTAGFAAALLVLSLYALLEGEKSLEKVS